MTNPHQPPLPSRIALIGFMGAGKTTVGKILAEKLGYRFVDTDDVIVDMAGAPIAEIFQHRGEPAFRAIEAEALRSLAGRELTVIAAGGGAPAQESNRQFFLSCAATFHLRVSMRNARGRAQAPGSARATFAVAGRKRGAAALRCPAFNLRGAGPARGDRRQNAIRGG